jgi:hypothetical protein
LSFIGLPGSFCQAAFPCAARLRPKKSLQYSPNRYYARESFVSLPESDGREKSAGGWLIMDNDVKIYERPLNLIISVCMALGCLIIGLQYYAEADTRITGIFAFALGAIFIVVAIYVARDPKITLGNEYIMFREGNVAKKQIPYSMIESWTLQNEGKHLYLHLKKSDKDENNEIKEILINYRNIKESDRQLLTDALNIKGILQRWVEEPVKKGKKKK